MGYALHREFWNQGYATEVASGLFDFASNQLMISDIVGIVIPGHEASAAVLKKIGFLNTGLGHYFGMDVDVYRPRKLMLR